MYVITWFIIFYSLFHIVFCIFLSHLGNVITRFDLKLMIRIVYIGGSFNK